MGSQDAWIESLNARLRDEVLDAEEFSTLAEARFRRVAKRLQREPFPLGVGMMSPSRFAASWQRIGGTKGPVNPFSEGVDR